MIHRGVQAEEDDFDCNSPVQPTHRGVLTFLALIGRIGEFNSQQYKNKPGQKIDTTVPLNMCTYDEIFFN